MVLRTDLRVSRGQRPQAVLAMALRRTRTVTYVAVAPTNGLRGGRNSTNFEFSIPPLTAAPWVPNFQCLQGPWP